MRQMQTADLDCTGTLVSLKSVPVSVNNVPVSLNSDPISLNRALVSPLRLTLNNGNGNMMYTCTKKSASLQSAFVAH